MTQPTGYERVDAAAIARTGNAAHIRQLLGWLGDSKHQLELALKAADLGVWHWSPSTGELVWCQRCRSLLGVAPDTPASFEKFMTLVHADDRARVARAVDATLRSGGTYSLEFRIVLPSGAIRWLHSLGRRQPATARSKMVRMSGVVRDVTEDHRASEAKARQQQYQQQVILTAPVGAAQFDRHMRFLIANERFVQGLRLSDQPLVGRSLYAVLPEISQAWRDGHQRCLAGATLGAAGEALPRSDGSVDWVSWQIYPWHDEHNEIGGIFLVIDVLTQRRHIEAHERLWMSEFIHNSHAMIIVDPSNCTISSANPAYGRLSGYRPDELPGRSVWSLCPEAEHGRLREVVERSDAKGSCSTESLWLQRDGTPIPTALKLVSVRDAEGTVQCRVATVTDLRERERAEAKQEAQRLNDERFRLLAESAPIGIFLVDPEGAITYANPAWLATTAITLDQAVHNDWFGLIHPDDHERVMAAWRKTLKGAAFDQEFRYRLPSGEVRWVQAHATALKDTSGNTIGYVSTSLDITDRLLERATSDRFHSQFRLLAQRLDHLRELERSELAYSLRSELNDDLRTLKTGLAALSDSSDVGELAQGSISQFAGLAEAALERLRHIIFDLVPPGIEELGFAGALERYISEHAARSGLQITLSVPEAPLQVPAQIAAVLYGAAQEALGNAIRHAHATRIDLSVTVNSGTVRLRVADDGIGMGEKDRHKPGCFGLFATSERLAQIGGSLRTLGAVNQGTTFEASAPLDRRRRQRSSAE
ncbi:MAG: PAS domain S-box protein [Steroidobacterales bacterium]